jgi:hypothetical protein
VIAAGENFELLHINMLYEMAQATPAIVADRLLLLTESRLYSIRNKYQWRPAGVEFPPGPAHNTFRENHVPEPS